MEGRCLMKKQRRRALVVLVGMTLMLSQSAYADGGETEIRSCVGHDPVIVCWPPW